MVILLSKLIDSSSELTYNTNLMRASPENGIPRSETPLLGDISEHYLHQATLPPGTNAMTLVTTMQQIYQKIEQKQKIILVIAYPDKPPDQSIATTEETINKNIVYVVKKHFFRRVDGKIVTFDENGDTHTMGEIINDAYANNRTVFFELIDYNAVPALLTEFASPKKQITNEEKVSEKKTVKDSFRLEYSLSWATSKRYPIQETTTTLFRQRAHD